MVLSIYKFRKKCSRITEVKPLLRYFSIWYLIVTQSINGEQFKLNTTEIERFTITSGYYFRVPKPQKP